MDPSHVMSFSGAGSVVESITLCGVPPGQVNRVLVCKGHVELVNEPTLTPEDGNPIPAGLVLANRAAMSGHAGMRIEFDHDLFVSGPPLVLSAWVAHGEISRLQVVVKYRADR